MTSMMLKRAVRLGFAAFLVVFSMGARGSCGGGGVNAAQTLCEKTGGAWDDSDCPKNWPPECGQSPTPSTGCGEEEVCKCPATKPFWKDGYGCWSQAQCD